MKRLTILFALICFIGISSSFAQKKVVDDMYGRDTSEAPPKSVADTRNFTVRDFVEGYVIMPDDQIQTGLVRFNGSTVIFKNDSTQKIKRYGAREVKGFVAGADTFHVFTDTVVVRPNIYTRGYYGDQIFINPQFNRELAYGPKVSLYMALREIPNNNYGYGYGYRYRGNDGTIIENALYLKRKNQWGYTYIPENRRDFRRVMVALVADDQALATAINDGRLTYSNMSEIVARYNSGD